MIHVEITYHDIPISGDVYLPRRESADDVAAVESIECNNIQCDDIDDDCYDCKCALIDEARKQQKEGVC